MRNVHWLSFGIKLAWRNVTIAFGGESLCGELVGGVNTLPMCITSADQQIVLKWCSEIGKEIVSANFKSQRRQLFLLLSQHVRTLPNFQPFSLIPIALVLADHYLSWWKHQSSYQDVRLRKNHEYILWFYSYNKCGCCVHTQKVLNGGKYQHWVNESFFKTFICIMKG